MHIKLRKPCEVLMSTVIVSVMTVTLFWTFAIIRNWQGQTGIGSLLAGFVFGILFGLLTMGIFIIPGAFLVSLLILFLKRWSWKGVAMLLLAVVIWSLISFCLAAFVNYGAIDIKESKESFVRFTLWAVGTGFFASLIAWWSALRCRKCCNSVA
jgi:hypothetical protein